MEEAIEVRQYVADESTRVSSELHIQRGERVGLKKIHHDVNEEADDCR